MRIFALHGLNDFFDFGKHNGLTLKEVVETEISYLDWCIHNVDNFYISEETIEEIQEIKPNFSVEPELIEVMNNIYQKWEEWQEEERQRKKSLREEAEASARQAMYDQWNNDAFSDAYMGDYNGQNINPEMLGR